MKISNYNCLSTKAPRGHTLVNCRFGWEISIYRDMSNFFLTGNSSCKIINIKYTAQIAVNIRIGGSVVECSPATRAARVRFPADAHVLVQFGPVSGEGLYQP